MKVCAHINTGPHTNWHERFDSIADAVTAFRQVLDDTGVRRGDGEHYTLDVFDQCGDCDSAMNFHDWPLVRFVLGPRGGIRRETV